MERREEMHSRRHTGMEREGRAGDTQGRREGERCIAGDTQRWRGREEQETHRDGEGGKRQHSTRHTGMKREGGREGTAQQETHRDGEGGREGRDTQQETHRDGEGGREGRDTQQETHRDGEGGREGRDSTAGDTQQWKRCTARDTQQRRGREVTQTRTQHIKPPYNHGTSKMYTYTYMYIHIHVKPPYNNSTTQTHTCTCTCTCGVVALLCLVLLTELTCTVHVRIHSM